MPVADARNAGHREREQLPEVPDVVSNPTTGKRYIKGKFLGKGGFARCYELSDSERNETYAGKAVSKTLLVKKHQRDKMTQEIQIHRMLKHKHIVGFHTYFEDSNYVYILLEVCRKRSLMELHKRRRTLTEPETRYFMSQLADALIYLHDNKVIHRDLKLGNLFINDDMDLKVGDFGLATKLDYDGERKKTLCGTPNYIAPEMLRKAGHSYEVDIWAVGCVLYTLLVGKPPFETSSLKDTYNKIKRNEYHVPSRVSTQARHLIQRLLQAEPDQRPNIRQMMEFDWFTQGYLPKRLPTSCLTTAPKFPPNAANFTFGSDKFPLTENNGKDIDSQMKELKKRVKGRLDTVPENQAMSEGQGYNVIPIKDEAEAPKDCYLKDLFEQLTSLLQTTPSKKFIEGETEKECEDPKAAPIFWIDKWVDYSDKYGLGYQLSDNSVGVLFNDATKLVLNKDEINVQYVDREGNEAYFALNHYDPSLAKKVTLLNYFKNYMHEHLLKAGEKACRNEGDELCRLPYLKHWFRTRSAIILHLTNGTFQVNFFNDHTKVILCPLMQAVTYIDEDKSFRTFPFKAIQEIGTSPHLESRLSYARQMVERLLLHKTTTGTFPRGTCTVRSAPGSQVFSTKA